MKVLGISGRTRDAAAAIAIDGHVIAAASEDSFTRVPSIGYSQTGGVPTAAVDACLATAGLQAGDLDVIAVVEDGDTVRADATVLREMFGGITIRPVDAVHADAVQAAASSKSDGTVMVCSTDRATIASYSQQDGRLQELGQVQGAHHLISAARTIARTLGVADHDSCRGLDRLSNGANAEFATQIGAFIRWDGTAGIGVDQHRLATFLGSFDDGLADARTINARIQQTRRAIAASFTCRVAELLRDASDDVRSQSGTPSIVFGGQMFGNPRLNTELRRLVGDDLSQAIVPEAPGRALGAALSVSSGGHRDGLAGSIALGPAFSDTDIKRALDTCRLDYVFEPDWQRVLKRVSSMLAQGKVVAWFQGAMAFGPRAMGTRSVLCDPSSRYARHNMNEYLRQVPLEEPLPVMFAPSAAGECLASAAASPFVVLDAGVKSEWRERLAAALDWRQHVRVHAPGWSHAPELCELLEYHYAHTRVPALIETNLSGPGEPIACTPRDAVRTVYSSAIDALILGRFILMKDYWLLRTNVE